jgi:hypothetical protein
VLVMAIVLLGTLMVLSTAFLRLGLNLNREHDTNVDDSRAFYIAEAGIAEAGAALLSGKSGNVGSALAPARFANGILWATATSLGNGDYRVDSTALCDSGRAAVRAVLHLTAAPPPTYAVTSNLPLGIGGNFLIDSYDPNKGSYASQPKFKPPNKNDLIVNQNATVRSNGSISFASGDRIYGDASPGPGGVLTGLGGNSFVTGSTAPASQPVSLPPVQVPSLPAQGAKSVNKADSLASRTLTPGSYHFTSLTLNNSSTFTIKGPATVVLDGLTTKSGSNLKIDATAGPVNIYITGATTLSSNMTVTSTAPTAKSVSLNFSSSLPVTLTPNATYIGVINAPLATLTVSSNWVNYGALSANQLILNSNVNLHYDESLGTPRGQSALTVAVRQWQRAAVPQNLIHKRIDPYRLLGLKPGTLLNSANAYL